MRKVNNAGSIAFLESQGVTDFAYSSSFDSIASEPSDRYAKWRKCISVLEDLRIQTEVSKLPQDEPQPNAESIAAATRLLRDIEKLQAASPPSMICVDPEGGIIVEFGRTKDFPKGELFEYVFFNDGRIEFTHYVDGSVLSIREWEPPADDLASYDQFFDNAPFASEYSSSFQGMGRLQPWVAR